jgi:septal ring factor EnvC (AmiA/AmiB activator)
VLALAENRKQVWRALLTGEKDEEKTGGLAFRCSWKAHRPHLLKAKHKKLIFLQNDSNDRQEIERLRHELSVARNEADELVTIIKNLERQKASLTSRVKDLQRFDKYF